ncbi:malto-oligosyltrehalose synthase [Agrobacterium vitis]|uniref:malto-oligosyltrehalose synthase n=1 Tax=Agrobacterium vitis TaxID=373 RepID=UPI00203391A6|nr:malto-oligosyltrehalose synthase [Agrobacterium vitis]MCM2449295.1 malto-oligosyltrehalose synthase [Agrobacterium vitis]
MTIPTATYRLQFRNGITFDHAIDLIPHLKSMSISHLYASPIFTATTGSTHGYDVVDANEIDPVIGGKAGFDRMCSALAKADIGLILDIVPNHMAASVENAWWYDVLRNGSRSAYAGHFDIDWSRKLTLPVLGKTLEEALGDGELTIIRDDEADRFSLAYFETHIPLSDESIEQALVAENTNRAALAEVLAEPEKIRTLLDAQHWQLQHWKEAAESLSYRRFFEVTGLVGVCVEKPQVFEDSHRLILDLVRSGQVQGLRIDHVDGLADPAGYLDRLREATGPQTYITVEKILGAGEVIAPSWPVSGTTGYEFITALSQLYIDGDGLERLQKAYHETDAVASDYVKGLRDAKTRMVQRNFKGEVTRLVALAQSIGTDHDEDELRKAILELLIAFPVYRTYGYYGGLDAQDKIVLEKVVAQARLWGVDNGALGVIERLLLGGFEAEAAHEFRIRFQQLSGPVMAKALEDTLFYRYNRLIAANEVGGEPAHPPGGARAFHAAMVERVQTQKHGLSASSTHDTKRGEDARARLYTLSEGTDVWIEGVSRWRQMHRGNLVSLPDGPAPDPNVEWMLYQALAGIWLAPTEATDSATLAARFLAYTEKALREAKVRTDWAEPNEAFEQAVRSYAEQLVSPENRSFLTDFGDTLRPFMAAGEVNSLSQTLIKLTAPGVPDIYQGTEGKDDSLVDPDNRRIIDYQALAAEMTAPASERPVSFIQRKQRLIREVLALRSRHASLFNEGDYVPLEVTGHARDHVIAFARVQGNDIALTIAPRLVFGRIDPETARVAAAFWEDTRIVCPEMVQGPLHDILSGRSFNREQMLVSNLLEGNDIALLVTPSLTARNIQG